MAWRNPAAGGSVRVDAERVLRGVAAVGPHQPALPGPLAQVRDHGRDRVHHVVVPRPAGKAQPAGAGELRVDVEAERRALRAAPPRGSRSRGRPRRRRRSRRRRGRAQPHRRPGSPGCRRTSTGSTRTGARGSRLPRAGRPSDRGARRWSLGPPGGADDDRGRHVDVVVRVHRLRVGPADHPVARRDGGDLAAVRPSRGATRTGCRPPPSRTATTARRCAPAWSSGQRPAAARIAVSNIGYICTGRRDAPGGLGRVGHVELVAEHHRRLVVRRGLAATQDDAFPAGPHAGAPRLAAGEDGDVEAPGGDVERGPVDERLGRFAAGVGGGELAGGHAETFRQHQGRVGVAPRQQVHHPHRVEAVGDSGEAGVGGRPHRRRPSARSAHEHRRASRRGARAGRRPRSPGCGDRSSLARSCCTPMRAWDGSGIVESTAADFR